MQSSVCSQWRGLGRHSPTTGEQRSKTRRLQSSVSTFGGVFVPLLTSPRDEQEAAEERNVAASEADEERAGRELAEGELARIADSHSVCCGNFRDHVTHIGVSRRVTDLLLHYGGKDSQQTL